MSKQEWQAHIIATVGTLNDAVVRANHDKRSCRECAKRRATKRHIRRQSERDQARRDLGLIKTPYGWE